MRARWEGVRADLLRSVSTLQAERQFKNVGDEILDRFKSPSELVAHLNDPTGDLDDKDWIYAVLVEGVQRKLSWGDLATSLLWLGLWPALDHIYRHRLRRFLPEAGELIGAIAAGFTTAIARANKRKRVHRYAATLTKNTHRDVTEVLKWREKEAGLRSALPEDEHLAEQREADPAFLVLNDGEPQGIAALRLRLLEIVGPRDVDLVLEVVKGESRKDAGERLGLSHDVSRKRYERALKRIRAGSTVVPFPPRKVRF